MASFRTITERLVAILQAGMTEICADALWDSLEVYAHRPVDKFQQAAVFVWRDATTTEWPWPLDANGGLQEMDGEGTWRIGIFVRLIGDAPQVASELDVLIWGIYGVLAGYAQDRTEVAWSAMTSPGTRPVILDPDSMATIGEEIELRIRWNREF